MAEAEVDKGAADGAAAAFFGARECAAARGGYAWWYLEAHDTVEHRYGLTLIFFAGAVFSPTYAARLRRGELATGLEHPAVNLVVYTHDRDRTAQRIWVMNEYSAASLKLEPPRLQVENSYIHYESDGSLSVELREDCTRFFGRPGKEVRARIQVKAAGHAAPSAPLSLGRGSDGSEHFWQPLLPTASADVQLTCGPLTLQFQGTAYCDRNFGSGRLEDAFTRWSWAHGVGGAEQNSALVLYRAERLDGTTAALALHYPHPSAQPLLQSFEEKNAPDDDTHRSRRGGYLWQPVPTRFSVGDCRAERLSQAKLEDAPFYARYLARLYDATSEYAGVGEYLDLRRFRTRAVQRLLTYKTRRVAP